MRVVVRAPNWIGDAVLALPAIECLSRGLSEAEIWITGRPWVKDLFVSLDFIRGFIPLPGSSRPKILWNDAKIIRKHRFDAGLLLTNSFASALVFFLAGIPQRWGTAIDGRGFLLTKKIRIKKEKRGFHQLQFYLHIVSALGIDTSCSEFRFTIEKNEIRLARTRLESLAVRFDKPLIILNPGAFYGPAKRWPALRFAQLASLFQERRGAQILIIGSPDEKTIAQKISAQMKKKPIVLSGETTLLQLAALLQQATLFVTNDTGPMHMANAMKIPVVAIFGPTDPFTTGPFQEPSSVVHKKVACWPCRHRVCPTDHRCMQEISAEEVFHVSERFLK